MLTLQPTLGIKKNTHKPIVREEILIRGKESIRICCLHLWAFRTFVSWQRVFSPNRCPFAQLETKSRGTKWIFSLLIFLTREKVMWNSVSTLPGRKQLFLRALNADFQPFCLALDLSRAGGLYSAGYMQKDMAEKWGEMAFVGLIPSTWDIRFICVVKGFCKLNIPWR